MTGDSDLKDYRALLGKVSAKFDEIHQRLIRSTPGLEEKLRELESILAADQNEPLLDACPLNFEEGLEKLKSDDFINIDVLNRLSSMMNIQYIQAREQSTASFQYALSVSDRRYPLTITGVLEEEKND